MKKAAETTRPTRYIRTGPTLELWVHSGGRCAICNKFLLEEPFFERTINLGERAHIAGWRASAGSPRGDSSVLSGNRNLASNLILLCSGCHLIVDNKATRRDYSEDRLLAIKSEHEDRIRHLTAMKPDRETTVLRVFGAVRGSVPEMARDSAIQTVLDGEGRFAKFPLAIDRQSIEIDLTQLPEPEVMGEAAFWATGCQIMDGVISRVFDGIRQKHIRHLSVFAMARIPFLVYLGYVLDNKIPLDLYQMQRGRKEGWLWPQDGQDVKFEVIERRKGTLDGVAVVLSLSGTITDGDLPEVAEGMPMYEIRPRGVTPNPSLLQSRTSLDAFTKTYQGLLSDLETTEGKKTAIHLFSAVPLTAAIVCGQCLMRDVHPPLRVYDRDATGFRLALTLNDK